MSEPKLVNVADLFVEGAKAFPAVLVTGALDNSERPKPFSWLPKTAYLKGYTLVTQVRYEETTTLNGEEFTALEAGVILRSPEGREVFYTHLQRQLLGYHIPVEGLQVLGWVEEELYILQMARDTEVAFPDGTRRTVYGGEFIAWFYEWGTPSEPETRRYGVFTNLPHMLARRVVPQWLLH